MTVDSRSLPASGTDPTRPSTPGARSRFRPDIEGIRALAVALVVLHHSGLGQPQAGFVGVDVFFVVSGFVITTQMLREVDRTGHLSLAGFYGRRAKRLLPAAGLVLVVTAIGSWLLASRVQWAQIAGDIIGAALYVVNWVFAGRSVDYLSEDAAPSPVLHYWSLSVEEQFYFIWPLVILALVWLTRRRHRLAGGEGSPAPSRARLAVGLLATIVLPSLIWSVIETANHPEQAFFVTTTRLWELGIGALVAIGAALWPRLSFRSSAVIGWVGLGAIAVAALGFSSATAWPGVAALVPTLGTAALIVAGAGHGTTGPKRLLGLRPLVWIGGLSYSIYLWHWPIIMFATWLWGEHTGLVGLAIGVASIVPAWASYTYVEQPLRHARLFERSPRAALVAGASFTVVAVVAGLALSYAAGLASQGGRPTGATWGSSTPVASGTPSAGATPTPASTSTTATGGSGVPAGLALPAAEKPTDQPFFDRLTPDPARAVEDIPDAYDRGCQVVEDDAAVKSCEYGDPQGAITVAVVGDSKIVQWLPAIDALGKEHGWHVRTYTKSACPFILAPSVMGDGTHYPQCESWGRSVFDRLVGAERPDVVLTSAVAWRAFDASGTASKAAMIDGYAATWARLADAGVRVVALSSTPPPTAAIDPVYACVAEHLDDAAACSWPLVASVASGVLKDAVAKVPTASYVDMDPWVCPGEICIGQYRNVLTYRQGSHITATFVTVLKDPLGAYLTPLVERAGVH